MLSQLSIENVALIDKLELTLTEGLNILSGETGAGKSIIIDSLNFVLGERADKTLIRYGTDFAVVQAVFEDYCNPQICEYLEEMGIEVEDVLILRRKMTVEGKNECRINGRVATLSILKGLTELLVDIHGQHEHQSLLKSANHLTLLDSIGESRLSSAKAEVGKVYSQYAGYKRELERYGDGAERERRLDILKYQIEEIERVNVGEGEEETLLAQRKRIRNTEKILSALQSAKSMLDGYEGGGVGAELKNAVSALGTIASFDDGIPAISDRLNSAKIEIADISDTLSDMLDKLDFDSKSADKIEERLEEVRAVTRKYGGSYDALTDFYAKAKDEADILENAGDRVLQLEKDIKVTGEKLVATANKLTDLRRKVGDEFEKSMLKELRDLSMAGSTFKVDIKSCDSIDGINAKGADNVEFLISPNVGEPLKPLAKIISGGEMSRFMLALKNIVAGIDGIGTMVFDEIDTGISGNVSAVVSEKLCNISRGRQVIAVTHMPSLSAMADSHYLISKSTQNGKTLTRVTLLEDDTAELARLIGGDDYSKFATLHAQEMKAWAKRYKESLK